MSEELPMPHKGTPWATVEWFNYDNRLSCYLKIVSRKTMPFRFHSQIPLPASWLTVSKSNRNFLLKSSNSSSTQPQRLNLSAAFNYWIQRVYQSGAIGNC